MQRDINLIQWILEYVEQKTSLDYAPIPHCRKYTPEQMSYHIGLCQQAGYLDAEVISGAEERFPRYEVGSLTWDGHETLNGLRS